MSPTTQIRPLNLYRSWNFCRNFVATKAEILKLGSATMTVAYEFVGWTYGEDDDVYHVEHLPRVIRISKLDERSILFNECLSSSIG